MFIRCYEVQRVGRGITSICLELIFTTPSLIYHATLKIVPLLRSRIMFSSLGILRAERYGTAQRPHIWKQSASR